MTLTMEDAAIHAPIPGGHFIAHVTHLTHLQLIRRLVSKVVMVILCMNHLVTLEQLDSLTRHMLPTPTVHGSLSYLNNTTVLN